jgi:hypothetical protein
VSSPPAWGFPVTRPSLRNEMDECNIDTEQRGTRFYEGMPRNIIRYERLRQPRQLRRRRRRRRRRLQRGCLTLTYISLQFQTLYVSRMYNRVCRTLCYLPNYRFNAWTILYCMIDNSFNGMRCQINTDVPFKCISK